MNLRYTLTTDGSSDRVFIPVLNWLLAQHLPDVAISSVWADLSTIRYPKPKNPLVRRISLSLQYYPCEILFVHRDAEKDVRKRRLLEIEEAAREVMATQVIPPIVPVVPIRMQEAWLLFDEAALRRAANNPNGKVSLTLPHPSKVEQLPDPKAILYDLLRQASQLHGDRLKRLDVSVCAQRVGELTDDFSPLRTLSAFQALETDLVRVIGEQGW